MCAKNRNLGKPWQCFLQRASEVRPSPLVHSNTLFTKYMAVIAKCQLPSFHLIRSWSAAGGDAERPAVVRALTVCARCSCSGKVAGLGRCLVSTALRPDGTDWGCEDMLAQPLPLKAGSGRGCRADTTHYLLLPSARNLWWKKDTNC